MARHDSFNYMGHLNCESLNNGPLIMGAPKGFREAIPP